MIISALFIIPKLGKWPKCLKTKEWIKKIWCIYIYTMEYYLSIKKNEIMLFAGKYMELENIMLSEVSQTQMEKTASCLHMWKLHI
jgi:hypothetical protein